MDTMKKKKKTKLRSRDDPWYWSNNEFLESYGPILGPPGIALYDVYSKYAGKDQTAWPSQTTIMKLVKISAPTLSKYNKLLEACKLIKIKKRKGKNNHVTLLKVRALTGTKGPLVLKDLYRCTKGPLVELLNYVYSNKKSNKNQEEYKPGKNAGTSFKKELLEGCTTSIRNTSDDFTDILITLLRSKRKIMKRPDRKQWAKQFTLLHVKDCIPKKVIRRMLKWYTVHIGEAYVPDIRTAGGFRSKFEKLVAAKERYKKDEKTGDVDYGARRKRKKNKKRRMD